MNTANDSFRYRIWNEASRSQEFILGNDSLSPFWGDPQTIILDPESKILKTVVYHQTVYVTEHNSLVPTEFKINSVYPSPFNLSAQISFDIPKASETSLRVFDITGRETSFQSFGRLPAGSHQISWNGSGRASGIYFFKIESNFNSRTIKAVLLK